MQARRFMLSPSATTSRATSSESGCGSSRLGAFDDDAQAADLLQDYEAKIAALERLVGRQALEIEFLKGALKNAPRPRSASTSVITGPVVSPSPKDAG